MAIVVIPKINFCQHHLRKKTSKSAKYRLPLRCIKRPFKISTLQLLLTETADIFPYLRLVTDRNI